MRIHLVEAALTLAYSSRGRSGHSEYYAVLEDGSTPVFLDNPDASIAALSTDGTSWFWTETYGGGMDRQDAATTTEVWSAPFTANPTELRANAAKLSTLDIASMVGEGVAFQGFYAFYLRGDLYVVRGSDGATQRVEGPGSWYYSNPTFVSANEVWSIVNVQEGPGNVAFVRKSLAPWP